MTSQYIPFRCPDGLLKQVNARGGTTSEALRESLSRYFYLLDRARDNLRNVFTSAELSLLCDVCNGTCFEPHTLDQIAADVEDAEPVYFEKWRIDRAALLGKLQGLSLLGYAALVDAIERYWRAASTGMTVNPGSILG